eukprot:4975868-Pleurochrysis_carterae.AAC.2
MQRYELVSSHGQRSRSSDAVIAASSASSLSSTRLRSPNATRPSVKLFSSRAQSSLTPTSMPASPCTTGDGEQMHSSQPHPQR